MRQPLSEPRSYPGALPHPIRVNIPCGAGRQEGDGRARLPGADRRRPRTAANRRQWWPRRSGRAALRGSNGGLTAWSQSAAAPIGSFGFAGCDQERLRTTAPGSERCRQLWRGLAAAGSPFRRSFGLTRRSFGLSSRSFALARRLSAFEGLFRLSEGLFQPFQALFRACEALFRRGSALSVRFLLDPGKKHAERAFLPRELPEMALRRPFTGWLRPGERFSKALGVGVAGSRSQFATSHQQGDAPGAAKVLAW